MKIGIFIKEIPPGLGGAYTFVETVLSSLGRTQKHQWIIFYYGPKPKALHAGKIQFVSLGSGGFLRKIKQVYYSFVRDYLHPVASKIERGIGIKILFPWGSRLDRAVRKFDIDLVWFPSPEYEWVDCPYIATVWDLEHRVQPYFPEVSKRGEWDAREKYFSSLLPRASFVITGTQVGKEEIIRHYGVSPNQIRVLPHPTPQFALSHYPDYKFPQNLGQSDQSILGDLPYILYPAQFWPHKNHVGLLKSLKWIHQNSQLKPHLVLVGSDKGNRNYIADLAKNLELTEYTHFLGFVSRKDLVALFQHAQVLAYPSLCGPENLPPLEAMAFGLPVVAADIAGSREQLGDNALLAPGLKPELFGAALLRILQEANLRKSLIEKGLKRAKAYTGAEFSSDLFKIIEEFHLIRGLSK